MLLLKDFDNHSCEMPLTNVKTIHVKSFIDTSCNGKKIVTGWGIDGTLYAFEVVPRESIPYILPLADEFSQTRKQPKNSQNRQIELTLF